MTTHDPRALTRDSFTLEQAARIVCDVPIYRRKPQKLAALPQAERDKWDHVDYVLSELQSDAAHLEIVVTEHPAKWVCRENFATRETVQHLSKAAWKEYGEVTRAALVEWCKARGRRPSALFAPEGQPDIAPAVASEMNALPPELAAAVEAFHAVRNDPHALSGTSPKQALFAWLEANKPELSKKAHDRIATVANWQPSGGAPKTPSGRT